jgi:hypothetical protein
LEFLLDREQEKELRSILSHFKLENVSFKFLKDIKNDSKTSKTNLPKKEFKLFDKLIFRLLFMVSFGTLAGEFKQKVFPNFDLSLNKYRHHMLCITL